MTTRRRAHAAPALLALLALSAPAGAQVVRDGSIGPPIEGDPDMGLVDEGIDNEGEFANFLIEADLGEQRGSNLFHSFSRFNLDTNLVATFTGPDPVGGPQTVSNVFGRITDTGASDIDGKVRSTIDGAGLFLFNPRGIVFGPNAKLDLKGDFRSSTADVMRFDDGVDFPTGVAVRGLLSFGSPTAYGFTSDAPAPITLDQSGEAVGLREPFTADMPAGSTVAFVGGDVTILGRGLSGFETIEIEGGTVEVASVAGPAEVPIAVEDFDVSSRPAETLGDVLIGNRAFVRVSGEESGNGAGGRVVVRGGRLVVEDRSRVISTTVGDVDGAEVAIDVELSGELSMQRSELSSVALSGAGRSGDVRIEAGSFRAMDRSNVFTRSVAGPGDAGDVSLEAGTVEVTEGGVFSESRGSGNAGDVRVVGDHVLVTGGGSALASVGAMGDGGTLRVGADRIEIADGAQVTTEAVGGGAAGDLVLDGGHVRIGGTGTAVAANGRGGPGGSILINADLLEVTGGGIVTASAQGSGDAGDVSVAATRVMLDGVDDSPAQNPSSLLSQSVSGARGAAGNVRIVAADRVDIQNGAQVSVTSRSVDSGATGSIEIRARNILIRSGEDAVRAASLSPNDAGGIALLARDKVQIENASVSTEARLASGGNIEIRGGARVLVRRQQPDPELPLVSASVQGLPTTRGGDVLLSARNVAIDRSGVVASAERGTGGTIAIDSDAFFVSDSPLEETTPGRFETDSSFIDVSGGFESGDFEVRSPDTAVVADIASLSEDFLDAAALLSDECSAREGPTGSLVVRGRDRAPAAPGDELRILYRAE